MVLRTQHMKSYAYGTANWYLSLTSQNPKMEIIIYKSSENFPHFLN